MLQIRDKWKSKWKSFHKSNQIVAQEAAFSQCIFGELFLDYIFILLLHMGSQTHMVWENGRLCFYSDPANHPSSALSLNSCLNPIV